MQAARVVAYRRLLKSLGVDSRSRWTPLEDKVAAHPAGAALASSKEREALFRTYVAELRVRYTCAHQVFQTLVQPQPSLCSAGLVGAQPLQVQARTMRVET